MKKYSCLKQASLNVLFLQSQEKYRMLKPSKILQGFIIRSFPAVVYLYPVLRNRKCRYISINAFLDREVELRITCLVTSDPDFHLLLS